MVVLAGALLSEFIVFGNIKALGVLLTSISQQFDTDLWLTGWMVSLSFAATFWIGIGDDIALPSLAPTTLPCPALALPCPVLLCPALPLANYVTVNFISLSHRTPLSALNGNLWLPSRHAPVW